MANYQPIPFSKEAVQLVVPEQMGDPLSVLSLNSEDFPVYRDTNGLYVLLNTPTGTQRANEGDWAMLEQDTIPAVPEVPEVVATGNVVIAGLAAGDGQVGFDYNGIVYAVSPPASQDAATTAQALVDLVNLGGQMTAVLNVATVELTAYEGSGAAANIALVDVTTDTVQTAVPTGLSGGVDFTPATPEIPAQFSVWTDTRFNELFQLV